MKTTALRIHGKMDLRLESFELPPCGDDGIIAEVISDSICMSSYKAAKAGPDHKRACAEPERKDPGQAGLSLGVTGNGIVQLLSLD